MAVHEIEIDGRRYYRIQRTIGGELHQKTFRIPSNLKSKLKARKAADDIDLDLLNQQAIFRARKARTAGTYLNPDGTIKGLTRRQRERAGRPPEDAFLVQVWNRHQKRQDRASFDAGIHGEQQAYELALVKWAAFRGIEPGGLLHQALKAQFPAYAGTPVPAATTDQLPSADDGLEAALLAEIQRFHSRKRAGVITGF